MGGGGQKGAASLNPGPPDPQALTGILLASPLIKPHPYPRTQENVALLTWVVPPLQTLPLALPVGTQL